MHRILHEATSKSTPNHPILPVIIYKGVEEDPATLFKKNGWQGIWENGVFDYHHYHPNAHEALGVKSGTATLQIGGENGSTLDVKVGDVLLLPAGYGHKRLNASEDFVIVGAYPTDVKVETKQNYDSLADVISEINNVPLPKTDPVQGESGPVFSEWHNIYQCGTVHG